MKASELRLGNLINYGDEPTPVDMRILGLILDDEQDDVFRPIPLTEEWIKILGFKNTDDFEVLRDDKVFKAFIGREEEYYGVIVKHVHQLQNLYFALTGEELKLKE